MIYTFAFKRAGNSQSSVKFAPKKEGDGWRVWEEHVSQSLEKDTREASQFLVNVCNFQVSIYK